jgi:ornithine cyclodeaminase/alanine dehydrogenase-like protein (mu-crystallin family)
MANIEILFLSQDDVIACSPNLTETREIIEDVFRAHFEERVVMPTKILMKPPPKYKGLWNALPAFIETGEGDVGGIKWLSSYLENLARFNLPAIVAIIVINDPTTGFPMAIMDGTFITGIRTGAAVASGVRRLSRTDSNSVAIIGNSVHGRFQLEAIAEALPIKRVIAYDIVEEATNRFISEMSPKVGIRIEKAGSYYDAVRDADIVISATRATEPFFKGEWCRPGISVASIGSMPELMPDVLDHADKVVVDDWEGCKHLGSLKPFVDQGILRQVYAEIGEIVAGHKPGRENEDEIILYVPMGMGSEDVAIAHRIYKNAISLGRGVTLTLCKA